MKQRWVGAMFGVLLGGSLSAQQNEFADYIQGSGGSFTLGGPTDGRTLSRAVVCDLDHDGLLDLLALAERDDQFGRNQKLGVFPGYSVYDAYIPDLDALIPSVSFGDVEDLQKFGDGVVLATSNGIYEVSHDGTALTATLLNGTYTSLECLDVLDNDHLVGSEGSTVRVFQRSTPEWTQIHTWPAAAPVLDLCTPQLDLADGNEVVLMQQLGVEVFDSDSDGTDGDLYPNTLSTSCALTEVKWSGSDHEWFALLTRGAVGWEYCGMFGTLDTADPTDPFGLADSFIAGYQLTTTALSAGDTVIDGIDDLVMTTQGSHQLFELENFGISEPNYDRFTYRPLDQETVGASQNEMNAGIGDADGDSDLDIAHYDNTAQKLFLDRNTAVAASSLAPRIVANEVSWFPRLITFDDKLYIELETEVDGSQIVATGANALQAIVFRKGPLDSDVVPAAVAADTLALGTGDQTKTFSIPLPDEVAALDRDTLDNNFNSVYYCLVRLVNESSGTISDSFPGTLMGFYVGPGGGSDPNAQYLELHNYDDVLPDDTIELYFIDTTPPEPGGPVQGPGTGEEVGSGSCEPCMPSGNGFPGCGPCATHPS